MLFKSVEDGLELLGFENGEQGTPSTFFFFVTVEPRVE